MLPELTFGKGVTQPPNHHSYDVFEHGMRAVQAVEWMLAASPPNEFARSLWSELAWCEDELRSYFDEELGEGRTRGTILKLAALLHDVAKPQTRTVDASGRIRFFGHADEGAATAARIMRRYRFSAREVAYVAKLIEEHLRPVQLAAAGEAPSRRAIYRFYRALGDAVPAVLFLALADAAASRGPRMTPEGWTRHVRYMGSLLVRTNEDAGIVDPPRLLTGRDIMSRFGVPEGPRVGELLEELREAQAVGDIRDRSGALRFISRRVADAPNGEDRDP
jgi:poly(A) polymerase